jgi:hypothetical protein
MQREKLERDYFRRYPDEGVSEIKEVTVAQKDTIYEVTVSADSRYRKRGLVQVVYRIKVNRKMKLFYLRSFIATE